MAKPVVSNGKYIALQVYHSALGTPGSAFVASPVDGDIKLIQGVLDVAVNGNVAITSKIAGTSVTGGGFSFLSSGSAAGQVKDAVPSAAYAVKRGQNIEIITDGGGTAGAANFTILIEQN